MPGISAQLEDARAPREAYPDDIADASPLIELPPCDMRAARRLARELALHPLAAQTLVRRGVATVEQARELLAAAAPGDPRALPGASAVARRIAGHVAAGRRIAVHGDYDVDGVCSTAILVRTLERLGAAVTWHLPNRFADGYGLSTAAIGELAAAGASLIVAVDCGVTAVAEVAYARRHGLDVAICDHHAFGEALPDAPLAHPLLDAPPGTAQLCAAGVVFKVCQILFDECGRDAREADAELDLVALATVCDVVPLRGENRALLGAGLAALRTTQRSGLRALMRVAGVDQLRVGARELGYVLGPRINAAGRMQSAEPAVELLLTRDEARAAELAELLDGANAGRRAIEREILTAAEAQARAQRDKYAIVVAGERWHAGVLGIVAGRIAERYRRPCVALGIEGERAAGSARAGGSFDLVAGLTVCAEHLTRYGGHAAAAGLELPATEIAEFRAALQAVAAASLDPADLRPHVRVDAVGEPSQMTLAAVESLERLGPFGAGNPQPRVLLPGVTIEQVRKMGAQGNHLRLSIASDGGRAGVVAFDWSPVPASGAGAPPVNLVVRLARNEFRGAVEPQARLVALAAAPDADSDATARWADEFQSELASAAPSACASDSRAGDFAPEQRRDESPIAAIAALGERACDAAVFVNEPSEWEAALAALTAIDPRLAELRLAPIGAAAAAAGGAREAIFAEPPPSPGMLEVGVDAVTLAWNAHGARRVAARADELLLGRAHVVRVYRALRGAAANDANEIATALRAESLAPRAAARAVRALAEVEILRIVRSGELVEAVEIVENTKTELDLSATFRSYSECREESVEWLRQISADR